jgi:heterodisulfide reductase subunit A
LKHALELKALNPDMAIYILYRDIMAYGFAESYYTQARKAGVIFIQYTLDRKPQVQPGETAVQVNVFEPIIGQDIEITTDLLVLATGVRPSLPAELAQAFGITLDQDGFFHEADSKWRPVDALKEGVFACGLAHSPRSITESIATAEAAAQRSLRILARPQLPTGKVVATVRHSLCSRCERCIPACPYQARILWAEQDKVVVNPAMCQGCGTCATVCPNSASVVLGFTGPQMFDVIDAALTDALDR